MKTYGEWSASRPGHITPEEKTHVPNVQEAGWGTEPIWMTWRGEKSCPYQGSTFNPSAIQPVASHYTNCAILAPRTPLRATQIKMSNKSTLERSRTVSEDTLEKVRASLNTDTR
jgi:hypothetical protein